MQFPKMMRGLGSDYSQSKTTEKKMLGQREALVREKKTVIYS